MVKIILSSPKKLYFKWYYGKYNKNSKNKYINESIFINPEIISIHYMENQKERPSHAWEQTSQQMKPLTLECIKNTPEEEMLTCEEMWEHVWLPPKDVKPPLTPSLLSNMEYHQWEKVEQSGLFVTLKCKNCDFSWTFQTAGTNYSRNIVKAMEDGNIPKFCYGFNKSIF